MKNNWLNNMSSKEILERMEKARVFLERLKEYAEDLGAEIDNIRKVALEITSMIIEDAQSLRDEILSLSQRLSKLSKK